MKEYLHKDLIVFDLDGTLAWSKAPIDPEVSTLLSRLLEEKKVGIISGGALEQLMEQVVNQLDCPPESLMNLYLLPTSGAQMLEFDGRSWKTVYTTSFSLEERQNIIAKTHAAYRALGLDEVATLYGDQIEDRITQITFSGLGQRAPLAEKMKWDPAKEKRKRMQEILQPQLPNADVRLGGSTSIDITKKGIDKAFGIQKLMDHLQFTYTAVLFVGDALGAGGNDHPVTKLPIETRSVSDPSDTALLISDILG